MNALQPTPFLDPILKLQIFLLAYTGIFLDLIFVIPSFHPTYIHHYLLLLSEKTYIAYTKEFLSEYCTSLSNISLSFEKIEILKVSTPFFSLTVPVFFLSHLSLLLSPLPLTHPNPHENKIADPIGMSTVM